jgi:glycerophosphoryl diester phosphodiesterase
MIGPQTADPYRWLRRRPAGAPAAPQDPEVHHQTSQDPEAHQGFQVLVVAHRGASALAPENTLAAFRLALENGAPAVECDVHLCADGVPVVIHDDTVDRTTDGTGKVAALPLERLRRLDAGSWHGPAFAGEGIPTLDEALAVCAGKARLFVEIKMGAGAPLVEATLEAIARAPRTAVAVISFGPEEVRQVAQRRPDLPLGFLVSAAHVARHGVPSLVQATADLGAGFVAPHHGAATPALLEAAHGAGLPVSAWTVDDPATMRALVAAGVDAITSNRPDIALLECRASATDN